MARAVWDLRSDLLFPPEPSLLHGREPSCTGDDRAEPAADEGTHFAQVVHPEDAHIIQDGFDSAVAENPNLAKARVLRTDGQVVHVRCTMIRVFIGGEIVGVHGVTEDVTAAKQILHQLQEANAAKALFLANVSDEVRTPLASVIGATELLMDDAELEPEPKHLVRIVHRNGQRLMHLVDDILDFSRLEARQVVLRPRPFGVHKVSRASQSGRSLALRAAT